LLTVKSKAPANDNPPTDASATGPEQLSVVRDFWTGERLG
jgi:hypothetical protein